jgi:NAD(P)-dependent dehydrogenase (short-subunit alcohol dehydrogenase family)
MELEGKRALVTGGAVRIGRAICLELGARGCDVVVHCRNSRAQAEELVRELRAGGVRAWTVAGALDDASSCARVFDAAWEAAGGLEILVNNAAVFHKESLREMSPASFLSEMQANAFAPVFLARALADRAAGGKIVNLLDRRVAATEKGCLPYLLSKKMLADFTRLAALELAPEFTVNGVAPGPVLAPPGEGEAYLKDHAGEIPLKCRCTPEDVAAAVAFLLTADVVTGQVVFVDGGQHLL